VNDRIKQLAIEAGYLPDSFGIGHWDMPECKKFAELIVQECVACCGSQVDIRNIRKHFGLPVESNILYPGKEASWSKETQYTRDYNIPK